MSNIELIIAPKKNDLGDNFIVRRSLPNIEKKSVGPFIFWDHMGPTILDKEMVVRAHPHIGLATITWLFSGKILHRDSLGNEQMIIPGEVNWMTAGSGIVHSERSQKSDEPLEGIQLWLALPKEKEETAPDFFHCKEVEVPLIALDGVKLRLIAGEAFGMSSPIPTHSPLFYLYGTIEEEKPFSMKLGDNEEGAIYIISGEIAVESEVYSPSQMIVFKKGSVMEFKASSNTKVMIFGGEVFPEKRFLWWNFVSTSKEGLESAKERWLNGEFPKVVNEIEEIPLPK